MAETIWTIERNIVADCLVKTTADGRKYYVPESDGNTDYQEYLLWVAEGNEPEVIEPDVTEVDSETT
jgi:hypothetical protein